MDGFPEPEIARGVADYLLEDAFPGGPVYPRHAVAAMPRTAILLSSRTPDQVWRALQAASGSPPEIRPARIVALGDGLLLPKVQSAKHDIPLALQGFLDRGGVVHSVGTCIGLRYRDGGDACVESTILDLVEIVRESDEVLVFE